MDKASDFGSEEGFESLRGRTILDLFKVMGKGVDPAVDCDDSYLNVCVGLSFCCSLVFRKNR